MANLSEILKSETLTSHKQVEKLVIDQIKKINNEDDYIALLEKFYLFYQGVEELSFRYLQEQQAAAELCEKRSPLILQDFEELQTGKAIAISGLSALPIPQNYPEALVALYVLEGSSLGGPYIAKMLEKEEFNAGLTFSEAIRLTLCNIGNNLRIYLMKFRKLQITNILLISVMPYL